MRVAHVVASSPYGGMQRLVAQIAEEQQRRGDQPHVIAVYEDDLFEQDLRSRRVEFSMTPGTRPSPRGLLALGRYLREVGPTLVHLHGGLLWPRATGLVLKRQPWIQHVHSYPDCTPGIKGWMMQRMDSHLCDAYIAISRSVADVLQRSVCGQGKPVYTIYNGTRTDGTPIQSPPNEGNAPTYGMATRLVSDKGVLEFVDVAREIARLQPGARFVLAGSGPLLSDVRARIRDEQLESRFVLPGHVVDVDAFWRSIDVAIFTAPREPLGLRILEPMALGIPVVAFRTGFGSDELIDDGVTGAQAPWGHAAALAQKAIELTGNPEAWRRISTAAAARVRERFSLGAMCNGIECVYNEVAGSVTRPRAAA